jgi:hypothetical protein
MGNGMFLKAFVDVPVSLDSFKETFSWEPERCFSGLDERAREEGERLLVEADLAPAPDDGEPSERSARLHVGEVRVQEQLVTVPVELAVAGDGRFPSLLGTIDAAWLGPERAHVSMSLQYEVPPDLLDVDSSLRRSVFHRVVEVVALHLLVNVSECLCVNCSVDPTYTLTSGSRG